MGDGGAAELDLETELALDRLEAQLAAELPAHVVAFARAYALGAALPSAPDLASRASTAALARRALAAPTFVRRGAGLLRIVAPLVIERDAGVAAARGAPPSWSAWEALARARDDVARARFRAGYLDVVHRLAGLSGEPAISDPADALAPAITGWDAAEPALDDAAILAAWRAIADAYGVAGTPELVRSAAARPRTFVVTRGARVIVVVPAVVDTPARRFAVLHELGHAALGLASRTEWPRALDEGFAALVAGWMEQPGRLPSGWGSALATPARRRRLALAQALDRIERRGAAPPPDLARPPAALWSDPGAQAAYVRAEAIADSLSDRDPAHAIAELEAAAAQIDGALAL